MREEPTCRRCREHGRVREATLVHHVVPLAEGGTHSPGNLMSVCDSCHQTIHAELGR